MDGRLKDGMSNLADNASSLGSMSSATGATGEYVTSLQNASAKLNELSDQYAASAASIAAIAGEGNSFGPEMEKCFRIAHPRATHGHREFREKVIQSIKARAAG